MYAVLALFLLKFDVVKSPGSSVVFASRRISSRKYLGNVDLCLLGSVLVLHDFHAPAKKLNRRTSDNFGYVTCDLNLDEKITFKNDHKRSWW